MIMYVGMSNTIYSFQAFFEFILDINNSYENDSMNPLCMIQAFISTYTSECMLIWITILSLTIHDTVKNKIKNMAKREKVFIFLGFVIPLVLSVIPFITGSFGRANGVCWITDNLGRVAELLQVWGLFYFPLWVCIFLNFILILRTMKMLKDLDIANTETYFVIRRFLYYPCLWIICWFAGTINRTIITFGGEGNTFLTDISLVLTCSQGFFTMIIFLSDKRILDAIKNRVSLSKTQIYQEQQSGECCDESKDELSQMQSKLLDVDDQDDYFSYYSSDTNQNVQNKKINDTSSNISSQNQIGSETDSPKNSKHEKSNQMNSTSNSISNKKGEEDQERQAHHTQKKNQHQNQNQLQQQHHHNHNHHQNQIKSQNNKPHRTQSRPNSSNHPNHSIQKKKANIKRTQKQQFETSGQWNRMEKIEEDSDEELFDKEIQQMNIKNSEQLFLSKRDAKLLYKQRKISNVNNISENISKRSQI
ncbi:7 transmembrane receptor secretin family protein (macronuclear) [Tetrahymena thermophila SB210]|uniref:7 transmembrane receptor secretin family protein n=1 Tax=Tetrahymena thermophila (strain SB210) TaxID=312017 RepID=I7MAG2_TETTS|nr:7 transmembrane receptor secretin family protein [Tetrahymena thermophila SB210]EAS04533.2 7 transmembrane receptor secretin family protein [Tetrahymena thermophila SB210]|eukprot:XP_001024778.2 7 transmembrane receptor secretin family protein [Tetrahymena thermophila SB210]